ncbi:hypothetical protein TUM18999_33020 [Pseudomonas tohonis]|uniref:Uncharacterized protein n=1 Tax=Pseudomonas tohonis TaxID=2725477 RepID=A0A6J4E9A9_9PSED|nr:hypothetical protein TUM18999_33020 [Pseudomonas tohonis]
MPRSTFEPAFMAGFLLGCGGPLWEPMECLLTRSKVPAGGLSRLKPLPQGKPAARPGVAALGLAALGANLRHRARS